MGSSTAVSRQRAGITQKKQEDGASLGSTASCGPAIVRCAGHDIVKCTIYYHAIIPKYTPLPENKMFPQAAARHPSRSAETPHHISDIQDTYLRIRQCAKVVSHLHCLRIDTIRVENYAVLYCVVPYPCRIVRDLSFSFFGGKFLAGIVRVWLS